MIAYLIERWRRYVQNRGFPRTGEDWMSGVPEVLACQRKAALELCDRLGLSELKPVIAAHRPEEPVPSSAMRALLDREPKAVEWIDRRAEKILKAHWKVQMKPWNRR